jgi:hypothetical protein
MKKIIATVLLLYIGVGFCFGQSFYFGASGGYGKGVINRTNYNSNVNNTAFGTGLITGIYAGYMFNKHFSSEIAATYLFGNKFNIYQDWGDNGTRQGSMYRIIPALKCSFGRKKIHTYLKAGAIISLGAKVIQYDKITYSSVPNKNSYSETTAEYKGGIGSGFHCALGINYSFTDKIAAFLDLAGYFQHWYPKKRIVTSYSFNGVDEFSTLTTRDKETEYVKDFTYSNNYDPNQPFKQPKFYFPFSSIGFNIGLHITLGNKKEEKKQ